MSNLTQPDPDVLRPVYESFVEALLAAPDDIAQPKFAGLAQLEFPELHEESLSEISFINNLNRLMKACGIQDFSFVQDIFHPVTKRTQRNLSALINFAKFRQEKLEYYEQLAANTEGLVESRAKLEMDTQALLDEIKEVKAQIAAEEPQIRELDEKNAALKSEILKLNQQQALYQKEVASLKENATEINKQQQNVKFELAKSRQEGTKLQGQIVKSPEKMRKSIKTMADSVKTEKSLITEAKSKITELQSRYDTLGKIEKDLAKAVESLEEMNTLIGKLKEYKSDTKEVKTQRMADQQKIREMETKVTHLQRQIKSTQEKTVRLAAEFEAKEEEVRANLAAAKRARMDAEREVREVGMRVDQNQLAIGELESKLQELKRVNVAQRSAVQQNFEKMESTVLAFHQDFTTALSVK